MQPNRRRVAVFICLQNQWKKSNDNKDEILKKTRQLFHYIFAQRKNQIEFGI